MSVVNSESSLFDIVMRESAEQWISVLDECEKAGYYVCPVDEIKLHWFLFPISEIVGYDN